MNREGVLGFVLITLLLGGLVLFLRRPASISRCAPASQYPIQGKFQIIPTQVEPRRYQNKEIREIEYNEDNLPIKITIIRDYAIT